MKQGAAHEQFIELATFWLIESQSDSGLGTGKLAIRLSDPLLCICWGVRIDASMQQPW